MRAIIGIDPGQKGAICVYGETIVLLPMSASCHELCEILRLYNSPNVHVFVEKAQAMPKNGAVGMFRYGQGFGEILGALIALRMTHTLVQPRTWTKVMHQGTRAETPKSRSLEAAWRLFPDVDFMRSARCKNPDEGFIDALLIAEYGRRSLGISSR